MALSPPLLILLLVSLLLPFPTLALHFGIVPIEHAHEAIIGDEDCPCADSSLCGPLQVGSRKELFVVQNKRSNFFKYETEEMMEYMTTISLYDGISYDMLCYAHMKGIRLVWATGFPKDKLLNEAFVDEWVDDWVAKIVESHTDGLNFHFQDPIKDPELSIALTTVVQKTSEALKAIDHNYQVSFDVSFSPDGVEDRFYDYEGIGNAVDFINVAGFGIRAQTQEPCKAGPSAPVDTIDAGISAYRGLGIPKNKIVLGVPWFGKRYTCTVSPIMLEPCKIAPHANKDYPCSNLDAIDFPYSSIVNFASQPEAGPIVLEKDAHISTYMTLKYENGTAEQLWFDAANSLANKYKVASQNSLRGIGVYTIDSLDFSETHGTIEKQTEIMLTRLKDGFLEISHSLSGGIFSP